MQPAPTSYLPENYCEIFTYPVSCRTTSYITEFRVFKGSVARGLGAAWHNLRHREYLTYIEAI